MASRTVGHLRRHAIAYVALFLALGGSAYAAATLPAGSVGTVQLKNGAVTLSKISGRARASLRGATGPQGTPGLPGAPGSSGIVGVPFSGPLTGPLGASTTRSFTKAKSTTDLLVTISGTGFRTTTQGPGTGTLTLLIDGVDHGNTFFFFNNTLQHQTLPTAQIVVAGLPAGPHTFTLSSPDSSLTTDGTDYYRVTMLEVTTG